MPSQTNGITVRESPQPEFCNTIYLEADIVRLLPHVRKVRWSQPVDATLYLRGKRWSVAMDREFRRGFITVEKTELWDRWQRGESLKAIGRAFGKPSSSIYFQVSPYGGIRPAPRRRSRLALTLSEREEISRGIAVHRSARSMAGSDIAGGPVRAKPGPSAIFPVLYQSGVERD